MLQIPKPAKRYHFSPLRYPGGKTVLAELLYRTIEENRLSSPIYIEPFAGGAGAALALLLSERVDSIIINDLDRAIYSFWASILENTRRFIDEIDVCPLTIEEWKRQMRVIQSPNSDTFSLGFAAFYLNRTNRSGILDGGPIGGIAQTGKWLLDARFNKKTLKDRIRAIGLYRDRIQVKNCDGLDLIQDHAQDSRAFLYIDPPYYAKGSTLYLNAYSHDDHNRLSHVLNDISSTNWVLSYDNVPQIRDLYKMRKNQAEITLHYQAHSSRRGSELMVFSDSLIIPEDLLDTKQMPLHRASSECPNDGGGCNDRASCALCYAASS